MIEFIIGICVLCTGACILGALTRLSERTLDIIWGLMWLIPVLGGVCFYAYLLGYILIQLQLKG